MIINHNMSASYASRLLKGREMAIGKNIEKLSSGMRINRGGDDASGLAVSEKLRAQIRGLNQASKNISNGISFIQATEGYLQESQDILHRVRELAVQAANGIYTDLDRMQIQVEVSQLVDEVDRIASHAQFNGLYLLTGRFSVSAEGEEEDKGVWFQVGANVNQREQAFINTMTADALGLYVTQNEPITISNPNAANQVIQIVDDALNVVSRQRADLGAYQNRFEMAMGGIDIAAENMQAAESILRDTNMAHEMVDYVKNQILIQSGTAMLAQANMKSQSVIQLLG